MNYGGLFESWEIATAKWVINEYREKYKCLRHESFDDLLQECLVCWLDLRDEYDPSRQASKKTFMAGVVKKELEKIAEKLKADKRKTIYEAISLDEPLNDDENAPTLKDQIPEDRDIPSQKESDLKIEVSKVYQKLTSQQKKLCKLLGEGGLTINEACKHFAEHRSTIYREISRIREIFEKEGLRDYLK
ncbi:MAG: sigma factor [Candidatus Omnitrophica bacterium]|nr:sigma factor [Candidatus Omnitrophota bacterium]